jgi:hypothetical protein
MIQGVSIELSDTRHCVTYASITVFYLLEFNVRQHILALGYHNCINYKSLTVTVLNIAVVL